MTNDILKQIWPEWQIEKQLGKGSYGVVYKVVRREHNIESYAAIKVISIPNDASEVDSLRSEGLDLNATRTYLQDIVNDFVSEIQLMESLKGVQNIVSVEDYKVVEKTDEIGWDIYIRMELLMPFNTYICDKKLNEAEVIKLGCDICTALEICSKRNIIHRDIKPENIFINDFGYFKLGDFGIARKMENLTGGLSQKGTFNYMAPEVASSGDYDAKVDTYSLGIVLYRLLNGNRLPFLNTEKQLLNPNERRNAVERRMRGEVLPVPCDASEAMAHLILRACAYDADQRFASATEMKQALMSVSNGTYQVVTEDLDKTTSVRHVSESSDKTMSVRKTSVTPELKSAQAVNSFDNTKKKRKIPKIIATILIIAILVVAGMYIAPKLLNSFIVGGLNEASEENINTTADYSKSDEEQITSIISEAEELAANEDYEGALTKVQEGLVIYPSSQALQEKIDVYILAQDAQEKDAILAEAATLAEAADYVGAMNVIETAQKESPEDEDYKIAYENYSMDYKNALIAEGLNSADTLSASGDYLGALQTINQTIENVGEDATLIAARKTYEDAYTKTVLVQVDEHLAEQDIVVAKEILEEAEKEIPSNDAIKERCEEIDKYKTVSLSTLTPINGGFTWNEGTAGDPFGNAYTESLNYTILHAETGGWNGHGDKETKYLAEYKVDGRYDCLNFVISPYSDFEQGGSSYVQIFVDNVLRYLSPAITQKTQPCNVSVDISDATYLKIIVYVEPYGCTMVSNMILLSLPDFVSKENDNYISISTLDTFNGWLQWNCEYPENTLGTDYTNVDNYVVLHAETGGWNGHGDKATAYSAEYYIDKQYSSISLDIAPSIDFGSTASACIKIYADGILKYTSPVITQKTAIFNTGEIDISNANYIEIVAEIEPYGCTIISDVLLENIQ